MSEEAVVLHVTQRFAVSPARVYDAWLDQELLGRWMFGLTMQDEVVRIAIDPHVGGRFSFVVRRNGQELDHTGAYLELERPRKLVFTWGIAGYGNPARVELAIAPVESGTELTLTTWMPPEWADYAERTRNGWSKILGALAATIG
jgi:uncharacterized protein YndB with AHSA1/START domain